MFFLSRLLQQLNLHRQLEVMADQIAATTSDRVWGRVADVISQLGPAQARGYVRARALAVVHAELRAHTTDVAIRSQLQDLALQRIVDRTLRIAQQHKGQISHRRAA